MEEFVYKIKDIVYQGKYYILVEGKEIDKSELQKNWEILVNGEVKKTLSGLSISALNDLIDCEDTILETNINLSFLSRMKYTKAKVEFKKKTLEHRNSFHKQTKEEKQPNKMSFFLDEREIN